MLFLCATRIIDQYRITCFAVGTSEIGAEATSESVVAWRMRQGHAW